MMIRPLHDRVAVRRVKEDEKTKGGLFIPDTAKEKPVEAVVLACLSMMYVINREAAARQIARVLKPGGRFVAAVWASQEQCDIVLFQQTAGRFAGPPPAPGVGPGALADPNGFLELLKAVGIQARVEFGRRYGCIHDFLSLSLNIALSGPDVAGALIRRQGDGQIALFASYAEADGAAYPPIGFARRSSQRAGPRQRR